MRGRLDSSAAVNLKIIVIAIVGILALVGVAAVILTSSPNSNTGNQDDDDLGDTTVQTQYTGAIMPNEVIYGEGPSSGYSFIGRPSESPEESPQTFRLQSTQSFEGITGGTFILMGTGSERILSSVVSAQVTSLQANAVPSAMGKTYSNIEATIISASIVYDRYTFGVGTTGEKDYIWIAPHQSYPTFFNEVTVKGMAMDQETLDKLSADFGISVFADFELDEVYTAAQKFGFSFDGASDCFLVINELTYTGTSSIDGDVVDTITADDLDRLSTMYCTSGTSWVKDVVSNLDEGAAFVTEADSSLYLTKLWILLYPSQLSSSMEGICHFKVSASSFSMLSEKVGQGASAFVPQDVDQGFQVRVGIMVEADSDEYSQVSVCDMWGLMGKGLSAQVDSVSVRGYGIVIDAAAMASSLNGALGLSDSESGLSAITTFKNPAFVLLFDEDFTAMFNDDTTPFWHYGAICIIPNYEHSESAFRYLEISGTLYDLSIYFSSSSPLFRIPLVISDSYHEVMDDLQQVSIKDLRADNVIYQDVGGYNGAYVEFESRPVGTTLSTLISIFTKVPSHLTQCMPIDLGMYLAVQMDGGCLYYVPVLYLSSGGGETYIGTDIMDIRGMYIESSVYSSTYQGLREEFEVHDNTSKVLPTGIVLAFAMDKVELGLSEASAIGPAVSASSTFDVLYSVSPSLQEVGPLTVELYWTDSSGWLGPIWHLYGTDPTPGDGRFPVDASKLDGDQIYGWLIRVKDRQYHSDNAPPGLFVDPEFMTRVNYLAPDSVALYYPDAPAPGTSVTLNWERSEDTSFFCYLFYMSTNANLVPGPENYIGAIEDQDMTSATKSGLDPGTQYYFVVRVLDLDGRYADSPINYTRTFASVDSGETMSGATPVFDGWAWTEETTFIFDEMDLFKIYLNAGETLTVDMIGNMLGAGDLVIYGPDGYAIDSSENIGVTEHVQITADISGYYYVAVCVVTVGTDWYTLWFYVA